jgi:uncharacterized membrane protein
MTGRWTLVALSISAALNLFLLGAAAGVIALGVRMAHEKPPPRPGALREAAIALSPGHRPAFFAVLRARNQASRPDADQMRDLRRGAWSSLAATPFDAAAAKAKLAQARDLDQQTRAKLEDAVIDFAATLPADERAALGQVMRQSIQPNPPAPPPSHSGVGGGATR